MLHHVVGLTGINEDGIGNGGIARVEKKLPIAGCGAGREIEEDVVVVRIQAQQEGIVA